MPAPDGPAFPGGHPVHGQYAAPPSAPPTWSGGPPPGYGQPPGYGPSPAGFGPAPGYPPLSGYPLPPGTRLVPAAPNGLPLAGFGDRFLAYLLDVLIVGVASLVLIMPVFFVFFLAIMPEMFEVFEVAPDGTVTEPGFVTFFLPFILLYGAMFAIMFGVYYVYFVEMMIRTGQTIGKRVVKIKIVPLNPAEPLNRAMGARRYLVQFIGGSLVPFGAYVDGFWQLWDKPYQQCLHDKFARTVVVKVPG